ncbi:hypothetical protein V6N11_005140 [Hibiscus sabdariffa]|uniref:EF-hand domain-containing protein n=1 Tax=Hibiscus sabdariffa TaxID=183260 RepID=A0ABR2RLZ0_9ROSI
MPKALKDILPPPGFPEFLNLLVARGMKDIGLGEGLAEAFREFDKDHNSFVSAAEFRRIPAESLQMPKLMRWFSRHVLQDIEFLKKEKELSENYFQQSNLD